MKRLLFFLLLIIFFLQIPITFYSGVLDQFVFVLEPEELLNSSIQSLNVLGLYLKYYQTGNIQYKNIADQTVPYLNQDLKADDKAILNVLNEYTWGNSQETIHKIDLLLKNYPNSVIVNAINVWFLFDEWKKTESYELSKNILSSIDIIKENVGINPFSSYYESIIRWNNASIQEKQEIYSQLNQTFSLFPDNKKIQQLLITKAYELSDYQRIQQIAPVYTNQPYTEENIMLIIAYSYYYLDQKTQARRIAEWLVKNSDKKNILSKSYELLGDISNTFTQKINYYYTSLNYDQKNTDALAKIGTLLYQDNSKDYLELSKMFLTKAVIFDPNNEAALEILKEIDNKYELRNFFSTLLPLFILSIFIIFIIYIFGKEKEQENAAK